MKIFKKIFIIIMITTMMASMLGGSVKKSTIASLNVTPGGPIRVGVLLYRFDDVYISEVRENLENIQKENEGKVEFTFFDGKGDQSIQNNSIDMLLKQGIDLLLVNLVDIRAAQMVINKIKGNNIPVILFNREPDTTDAVKSYGKAIFIGTDASEAGILQGKILIDLWNTNKDAIDINRNNTMQYIMLEGEPNNLEAIARTRYSVSTIQEAGIKTEELALRICDWDEELAKNAVQALLLNYGNEIEAIISNNDSMAIGAIAALQQQGYNNGENTRTIPVVGVDGIPQAIDLINKGVMTGTVLQDASAMAMALYTCGMNLVAGKSAIEGTEYKFDDTGVSIRIPYGGIYDNIKK